MQIQRCEKNNCESDTSIYSKDTVRIITKDFNNKKQREKLIVENKTEKNVSEIIHQNSITSRKVMKYDPNKKETNISFYYKGKLNKSKTVVFDNSMKIKEIHITRFPKNNTTKKTDTLKIIELFTYDDDNLLAKKDVVYGSAISRIK
ncbi:hypothetical protein [Aquimarina sp. RZ0]|uniref:hypothetical protein n=1 Tax=Aquimarina sp. RZ0 TaxID=2607730 RepID=UPI0011F2FB78|nr:hypothetical protein [Aquimarina sp. RZ0]KAA1245397.1 hypothetical protein F0000_12100 [Aquimarina sp. RZ0]